MKNYLLIAGLGLLAAMPARAQQPAQTLNAYFKSQGKNDDLGFGPGVLFRTDTVRTAGSAGGTVVKYYPSGRKYEEARFSSLRPAELAGRQTRWFENGQVQTTADYVAGRRQGLLLTYFADGTVRRREAFEQGVSRKAECFTAAGPAAACPAYVVFPEYAGGLMALLTQIQTSIRYPRQQIRRGIQGKVLVDFVIDRAGLVRDARVKQGVSPELDAEALRVVSSLRGWTPGQLDGEPADVLFTLPVTFAIR